MSENIREPRYIVGASMCTCSSSGCFSIYFLCFTDIKKGERCKVAKENHSIAGWRISLEFHLTPYDRVFCHYSSGRFSFSCFDFGSGPFSCFGFGSDSCSGSDSLSLICSCSVRSLFSCSASLSFDSSSASPSSSSSSSYPASSSRSSQSRSFSQTQDGLAGS